MRKLLLGLASAALTLAGGVTVGQDAYAEVHANLTDVAREDVSVGGAIRQKASEAQHTSDEGDASASIKKYIASRAAIDDSGNSDSKDRVDLIEMSATSSLLDAATFALAIVLAALVLPLAIAYRVSSSFRQAILALSAKQGAKAKRDSDSLMDMRDYRPKMLVDSTRPISTLLTPEIIMRLIPSLPFHLSAKDWQLVYSSEIHGYSLHSAYRRTAAIGPCIVVGMDLNKYMFAAFCSESLKPNGANYFGNGECWVASLAPRFQVFKWSPGNNEQFVLATDSFLAFGGGGSFALWFDAQFDRGTSEPNTTFGNATYLTGSEAFKIDTIEIWSFAAPSVSASLRSKALQTMSSALGRIVTKS